MDQREKNELIVSSLWVVDAVFKKLKLDDEDLKSVATLYLYKLVERFDGSKGVKFTTYAYNSLFLYIRTYNARTCKIQKKAVVNTTLLEIMHDIDYEEQSIDSTMIKEIKEICNDRERKIVELLLKGYNITETAEHLNLSRATLYHTIREFKTKLQQFYGGEK